MKEKDDDMTRSDHTGPLAASPSVIQKRRSFTKLLGLGAIAGAGMTATVSSGAASISSAAQSFLNVKDFGAFGDGTNDDQAAIQAALDSVGTSGGVVYFPPGTYRINFPVFIKSKVNSTSGFVVCGSGQNCTLQAGPDFPANVAMLYILGGNGVVEDIGLDGSGRAQNGIEYAYPTPERPDDRTVTISRLAFSRMLSNGFHCVGGEAYQIRDSFFNSIGGYAIYSRSGGINSFIDGNYILGCGGVFLGAEQAQAEGVRITNNTILCSAGSGYGVYVDRGLEIIIAHNIIDQVATGSIKITNNSSYVKCLGNWLSCHQGGGIVLQVDGNANSVTISDNTFEGGSFQLSVVSEVIGSIHSVTVHNNIFNNTSDTAMFFHNAAEVSIIGNHCRTSGKESLFWGDGRHGLAMGNVLWKGPNVGSGLTQNTNLGW
ncbi:hypothetical protein HF319_02725 [Xanthomonas sp. Kuri4-1]